MIIASVFGLSDQVRDTLLLLFVVAFFVWFFIVIQNLPSEEQLRNYEPPIMSRVHAGDGKLVAEFATEHRVYVPSEELPDSARIKK